VPFRIQNVEREVNNASLGNGRVTAYLVDDVDKGLGVTLLEITDHMGRPPA